MIRYIKLLSIVITIVFLYLCTQPVAESGGSGTETVGGILVDSTGAPVEGAIVCIDSVDSLSSATFYDITNTYGEYYIDNVKAGEYNLYGYTPDSLLVIAINNIRIQYTNNPDTCDLGTDTMHAPGGITGRVLLDGEGKAGVDIYIPGTSFGAKSDDSGYFTMIYIIPGIYNVNYEEEEYQIETDSNVKVISDSIIQLGTKNLVFDTTKNPPPPKNLIATYDTLNGIMRITWDTVTVADLNKYEVFRSDSGATPVSIGFSDSTVFYHTVFDTYKDSLDTTEYPREYQVKSIDNQSNPSVNYSQPVAFTALSPTVVKTFFTFDSVDQHRQAYQEVTIAVKYENYKRTNTIIRWFAGEPLVVVRTDTVNVQLGYDTLIHSWPDSGLHMVCVEAVDDGGSIWRDSVEVTTVLKPDVWYNVPFLNQGRRFHSSAVVDNKLYTIGGAIDFFNGVDIVPKAIDTVECFSFVDSTWTIISPIPTARFIAAAATIDKKIYVIGGRSVEEMYNTIEIYNTETELWETADTMPFVRFGHAACVINDSIYLFGGYINGNNGPEIVNSIHAYDPKTGEWSLKSNMLNTRAYHQVVLRGDSVFILGGMNELDALSSVDIYNHGNNSIVPGTDMLFGRMHFGAALLKNNIYVFGGSISVLSPNILTNVEAYNPDSNSWIVRKSLPSSQHAFGTCVNKGVLYLSGGSNQGYPNLGQLKTVLKYYP